MEEREGWSNGLEPPNEGVRVKGSGLCKWVIVVDFYPSPFFQCFAVQAIDKEDGCRDQSKAGG